MAKAKVHGNLAEKIQERPFADLLGDLDLGNKPRPRLAHKNSRYAGCLRSSLGGRLGAVRNRVEEHQSERY
jgi:hypothetical protein